MHNPPQFTTRMQTNIQTHTHTHTNTHTYTYTHLQTHTSTQAHTRHRHRHQPPPQIFTYREDLLSPSAGWHWDVFSRDSDPQRFLVDLLTHTAPPAAPGGGGGGGGGEDGGGDGSGGGATRAAAKGRAVKAVGFKLFPGGGPLWACVCACVRTCVRVRACACWGKAERVTLASPATAVWS
jgi:hypothetical protein